MKLFSQYLFILSLLTLFACQNSSNLPKHPNVLYISIEDLSPRLGCYGDTLVKSPHIDQFAKESVLFKDVHCQVALCTPSRTSILTGIRPSTSGIVKIDDDWKKVLPHATSLPRHFRNNGYFTYRVGKIADPRSGGLDDAWNIAKEEWGVASNEVPLKAMQEVFDQNKPFFLAIGYKQTHDPWNPSQKSLQKYDWNNISIHGKGRSYKKEKMSEEEAQELAHRYYADITDVDSLVGGLIRFIKTKKYYQNTIILVGVMDHGYSLGHHNKWGKGGLYDTQTQVPLLIRVPGNQANGNQTAGLIELVDLYPTLNDLCNLPAPPQQLEGHSFKKLLFQPQTPWKKAVFTHRAYGVQNIAVKTREYGFLSFENGTFELYNRKTDPLNLNDIAEENPQIVQEMQHILAGGWKNTVPEK